ncbi:MAG: cation:proton antiporter [Alphaproteobacteria bacterium]
MADVGFLLQTVLILLAAVCFVPLFQWLRLGPVLGYLVAGAVIGPSGLALIKELEPTQALAELGVVFLLFTVGLELPLARFRVIPPRMFGLGVAQIVVTAAAVGAAVLAIGGTATAAIVVGGGLALSSTTIVLRLLSDRGDLNSRFGRSTLAVLLVQDLAVGPLLVAVVALGGASGSIGVTLGLAALKAALAVALIVGLGRYVVPWLCGRAAATRLPEVFAALTLMIVLCAALATHIAGLTMGFGAFLAGMLLAETSYRHQVAAEIQPFRGLLLGLFFITVGMAANLELAGRQIGPIVLMALGLLIGKAVLLGALGRLFGLTKAQALQMGLLLSQGGEFAFVLLGAGIATGAVTAATGQTLVAVVALTMMATPALAQLARRLATLVDRFEAVGVEETEDLTEQTVDHVVIAGFGRVGRAVGRRLTATNVPFVAVDLDPSNITHAREQGLSVYYGDACRPEVLEAVRVDRARAVVVALNDPKAALQVVSLLRYIFPELKIFVRAYDDAHAEELRNAGANEVVPELVATGDRLAGSILEQADERRRGPG